MTFLELCKKARQEARITGNGPSRVNNQGGVLSDVVEAVRDAWLEIQRLHESWEFMGGTVDAVLAIGQRDYALGDLGLQNVRKIRHLFVSRAKLHEIPWPDYVNRLRHTETTGAPRYFAFDDSGRVHFDVTPDQEYAVTVLFSKKPTRLETDGDTPALPSEFHDAIMWLAVMSLTANESDTVIYQKAFDKYDNLLARMENDLLPPIELGSFGG